MILRQTNMKYFLFFFFSICVFSSGNSQNSTELSQQSFESIRDSINKYTFSNFEKTIEIAEVYITKAQLDNDLKKEWLGLEAIAMTNFRHRNFQEADKLAQDLVLFAQDNQLEELEIRAHLLLGDMQTVNTTIQNRLMHYNKALELSENRSNERYREISLNRISDVLEMSGDFDKATRIRKKTINLYEEKEVDTAYTEEIKNGTLIFAYSKLVSSYIEAKQIDSAKYFASFVKNYSQKEVDSCYLGYQYLIQSNIDFEEKNFEAAKTNYKKGSAICAPDYDLVTLNIAYGLGRIEEAAENYTEAIRLLKQGLDDYQVTPQEEPFMKDYYNLLAESYKHTGDFENASYYFEKYLTTREEYTQLKNEAKTAFIEEERRSFEKEFLQLTEEKERKQDYLNYLFLGASLVILGLLFLLLRFYKIKKQNEIKFEALLAKINKADQPSDIIDTKDEVLDEKHSSDLPEETKQTILDGLKKLEAKEFFLKQECNSYNVAKKINTSYLSKVINEHFGKNFNTYINDLRINYAIVRLKNDVIFRSYSIQSIAEELGYKSADSFTKYFKKDTGLNPSFYIKEIKNMA